MDRVEAEMEIARLAGLDRKDKRIAELEAALREIAEGNAPEFIAAIELADEGDGNLDPAIRALQDFAARYLHKPECRGRATDEEGSRVRRSELHGHL